jgi:hypothetical protein
VHLPGQLMSNRFRDQIRPQLDDELCREAVCIYVAHRAISCFGADWFAWDDEEGPHQTSNSQTIAPSAPLSAKLPFGNLRRVLVS